MDGAGRGPAHGRASHGLNNGVIVFLFFLFSFGKRHREDGRSLPFPAPVRMDPTRASPERSR